jgi:hypothetical protein
MASSEMAIVDRNAERPPLKPSDVYRPRLGAQREPLAITTMSEIRAWRAISAQAETAQPERGA